MESMKAEEAISIISSAIRGTKGARGSLVGKIKNRILEKIIENPSFSKKQATDLALNIIRSNR